MADKEFQRGALRRGDAQLLNLPPQGGGVEHGGRPHSRVQNARNHKVGIDDLIDYNIGGAGLGDVGGQFCKELFQLRGIRGNRHMGSVGVCGPVVKRIHIYPVRSDQADAVDDDTLSPGCGRHRSRRGAGGRVAVGKHDNDLRVTGAGVE